MTFSQTKLHDTGLLIFRLATGGLMLLHGIGKLIDLFGGRSDFYDPFGIGGVASLTLVTFAEFVCSILVIIGLKTRLALIPLITAMLVASFLYHHNDELMDKDLPLLFLMNFIVMLFTGPGKYSVDGMRGR